MSRQITLSQLQAIVQRLTTSQAFFVALTSAALYYKSKVAIYPRERHEPQAFKTDKQRRGFFAKLRAGEIEVPYRRGLSPGTEALGRSWRVRGGDGGWTQTVGSPARYASLVQGARQSFYHKTTGWQTVEDVYEREQKNIAKIFVEHFRKLAERVHIGG